MRLLRTFPAFTSDNKSRIGKQQCRRRIGLPRREQSAGVIEMQMRQHYGVDVFVREAGFGKRGEQHMVLFNNTVAFFQARFKKCANAGLKQHSLVTALTQSGGEQRAAGELQAVLVIGREPARPHQARGVAEHRAAVELLRIAENGPELDHHFTLKHTNGLRQQSRK